MSWKNKKEDFNVTEDMDETEYIENAQEGMSPEKTLALSAFLSLKKNAITEMRGGYYNIIRTNNGDEHQVYVTDSREVYCANVLFLRMVLYPFFRDEDKLKDKKWIKQLNELKQRFLDESSVDERQMLSEAFYEEVSDKKLLEEYRNDKFIILKRMAHHYWSFACEVGFFEVNNKIETISYSRDMTEEDFER